MSRETNKLFRGALLAIWLDIVMDKRLNTFWKIKE